MQSETVYSLINKDSWQIQFEPVIYTGHWKMDYSWLTFTCSDQEF